MDIGFNGDCDCPLDRLIHVCVSRKDEFQTLGWRQCTSDPERYPTQTRPCGGHSVSRLKSAQSYKAAPTSTSTISAMKSSAAFFEMSLTTPEVASISGHRDIPHVDEVCAPDEAKDHRADGQGREAPQEMSLVLLSQDTISLLNFASKKPLNPSEELLFDRRGR